MIFKYDFFSSKSRLLRLGASISVLIILFIPFTEILAQSNPVALGQSSSSDELEKQLQSKRTEIEELERKLSEVRSTAKTLKDQISFMDNQIRLTQLKISQLETDIERLTNEILKLDNKITYLDTNLDQLAILLTARIRETYKRSSINPLSIFLGTVNLSQVSSRVEYLRSVQLHDRQLLLAMEQTKSTFEQQRSLKEQKQDELDQTQKKLQTEKTQLDQQKVGKQSLLETTKNDEHRYQQMLAAAQAEQSAIQSAISQAIKFLEEGTPIQKGDKIALMGNSGSAGGCSTAAHLHFEVTDKNGTHKNPADYLRNAGNINWDNSPDSPMSLNGSWDWPMSNPRVTQGYGYTYWAKSGFYSGKPHTGIDMVDDKDIVIRSPRAGKLHKGAASCRGKPMNYVAVEHEDGLITWYWHVQ